MQPLRFKDAPYGTLFVLVAGDGGQQCPLYLSQANELFVWHEVCEGWLKYLPIPTSIVTELNALNPPIIPLCLGIDRDLELRFYRGPNAEVYKQIKDWFAPIFESMHSG